MDTGRWRKAQSDHVSFRGFGFAELWHRWVRVGPSKLSNLVPYHVLSARQFPYGCIDKSQVHSRGTDRDGNCLSEGSVVTWTQHQGINLKSTHPRESGTTS